MKDYDRDEWPHWRKVDEFQDSRQSAIYRALIRDRVGHPVDAIIDDGRVTAGFVHCLYTGEIIDLTLETPDCDHLITLAGAHYRGGYKWGPEMREKFANDPENLFVVKAGTNRQKGADMIAEWIPPRINILSDYLHSIRFIVEKYGLIPTDRDRRAWDFMSKYAHWAEKGIRVDDVEQYLGERLGWRGWG